MRKRPSPSSSRDAATPTTPACCRTRPTARSSACRAPGVTAERYPDAVEQILAAGHEVGHHSYAHFSPFDQDEAAERSDFERALEALARFEVDPKGFRCPSWEPTCTRSARRTSSS